MSKRKKHNPTKRLITQTLIAVKDLALTMRLSKDDKVDVVSCKTKKRLDVITPSLAKALGDTAFKWGVLLVVWAQESNGKVKTVTEYIQTAPYRHEDLTDFLRESHQALIDKCKGLAVDAGWVACPAPWTDDIDELVQAFEWSEPAV